jgi:hypothetical protein
MAIGQISEDLLPAMHSADVPVRVMLVDPRVDGLRAPVFELNLHKYCWSQWGYMLANHHQTHTLCDV